MKKNMSCLRKGVFKQYYVIGFVSNEIVKTGKSSEVFKHIKWVDTCGYSQGWFADPFILSIDDDWIVLLAEEKVFKTNRGRLVKLTISARTYKLLNVKPILELDTHLSFPLIYVDNGKIYVCPENRRSGELPIYEYDSEKDLLINRKVLIPQPLVDSQIFKINNQYFIFSVCQNGDKNFDSTLIIYESDSLLGPYRKKQVVVSDNKNKRGAGSIFEMDGRIIRPSQDCSVSYGGSVLLNSLTYDGNQFYESIIGKLEPVRCMKYGLGLHTFNIYCGICVVDGKEYKYRFLARFLLFLHKVWKKIRKRF